MIHPTAVIHPQAKLDATVQVGPFAVIEAGVEIGPHCVLGPHVYLTGLTHLGAHNRFHAGCVIGDAPQDLKYDGTPTRLRIGEHNVFREHVTVHRSTTPEGETVIGSHNFFMAGSHVAHNCLVGDQVVFANGALLAGHVTVEDRVFISGNAVVHQFLRVGTLSMIHGGVAVSQDVPPFTLVAGDNTICGLNIVGLRRAGMAAAERMELKQAYRALFRSGDNLRAAAAKARDRFTGNAALRLIAFVAESKRGVCMDVGARAATPPEGGLSGTGSDSA